MKYYLFSTLTRFLLGKLRKYHKDDEQMLVFSRDFIGEEIFAYGSYEKTEIKTIIGSFKFDSTKFNALDIGANIGNHSLVFSKHFKNVYCFEPNNIVYHVLKLNTLNKKNIKLHNIGLSDQNTKSFLSVPQGNIGGGEVLSKKDKDNVEISLKRFDENFNVDFSFVKIDIEGHELSALNGMKDSLIKYKPLISFELINSSDHKNDLIRFLRNLGYNNFYIPYEPKLFFLKNSRSFLSKLLSGLFLKNKCQLKKLENFERPFYNIVVCEHQSSNFRINKNSIRK